MSEEWRVESDLPDADQREAARGFLAQSEQHPQDERWQTVAQICRAILQEEVRS